MKHKRTFKKIEAPKRGRPVDENKRDLIMKTATRLFMELGFNNTSMDQIAKACGISKITLYSRFRDKNSLFEAVIAKKCEEHIPAHLFDHLENKDAKSSLLAIGRAFFSLILSDDAIRMYRMMSSEAQHNPSLTGLFYKTGPLRVKKIIEDKMIKLSKLGLLKISQPAQAQEFFLSLFAGSDIHMRCLLNVGKKPTQREIDAHIENSANLFLKTFS